MTPQIGDIITKRKIGLESTEIKQFIGRFFTNILGEGINCASVSAGQVDISVSSPTIHQEALLLEYDLIKEVAQQTGYQINNLRVRRNY